MARDHRTAGMWRWRARCHDTLLARLGDAVADGRAEAAVKFPATLAGQPTEPDFWAVPAASAAPAATAVVG
jgi:hypothetical protein